MDTVAVSVVGFGYLNFGGAKLGNVRRTKRLIKTADLIDRHPGGSLPDKFKSPAALKGLYRLVKSDAVTHQAVLEPHRQLTLERMRACAEVVLILHDTTELDYTGKKALKKLGQIGNGHHRGYLCHNSLAVVAGSRSILGLANQILYCRPQVDATESRTARQKRSTRESRLWQRASDAIEPAPGGKLWVDVADRGADLFEFLDAEHARGRHYVVRSHHNRWVFVERDGKQERVRLHDYARQLAELGQKTVDVPPREGRPGRTATVRVAAGRFMMPPPKNPRGEHRQEALPVYVVYVGEIDPPAGVEPVEWILLTDLPVTNFTEACERVDWYAHRWMIEELHKAQKTGCDIELPQFTKEERLQPVIALLSVVAVRLLQLREVSRLPEAKERLATEMAPLEYVEMLSAWRFKKIRRDLNVHEFFYALARLGGHQNRKGDHRPGWLILWRGWTKLHAMIEGAATIRLSRSG